MRARLLLRRVLAVWGSDDGRGGLAYAGLLALTLRFDRMMDLAFGIRDWREILGLGLPWDQIGPYWSAMWLFYFPGLLVLFSLACRSLIPLLWRTVVQLFGIHDLLYFLAQGIGMPGEFTYLEGTAAWSMAGALGFGALTPFPPDGLRAGRRGGGSADNGLPEGPVGGSLSVQGPGEGPRTLVFSAGLVVPERFAQGCADTSVDFSEDANMSAGGINR